MNSVMRRGSRKKQDASSSREEPSKVSPTTPGAARRQQHTQEILHQQRKKHQDEITNLTTKNYRLAKELVCFQSYVLYFSIGLPRIESSAVIEQMARRRMLRLCTEIGQTF